MPGIDAIFVGPNDLAASMRGKDGRPPTADATDRAMKHVLETCRKHKVAAGLHCGSATRREDELRPVWRPLRRLQPVQADVDTAIFPAALHVENHQVIAVLTLGRDREVAAVGRERSRRIDEAQALVVVVLRRFHQPPLDASRLGIRQPEIDEEAALIAEVRDLLAVRRERRREEDAPARVPLGQRRLRDAACAVVVAQLRQERRLDRVAPVIREILERAAQRALERGVESRRRGAL